MSDCVDLTITGTFGTDLTADGVTADADGIYWTMDRIDGWFDTTALRVAQFAVQPVGEVVTLARENARALALTLTAHTLDGQLALGAALCFTAMNSIDAVFNCVYVAKTLTVADPVITLHADVRRVGQIQKRVLGQSVAVQFLVPLLAPDAYLYDSGDNPFD